MLVTPLKRLYIRCEQSSGCAALVTQLLFRKSPQAFDVLGMHISIARVNKILTVINSSVHIHPVSEATYVVIRSPTVAHNYILPGRIHCCTSGSIISRRRLRTGTKKCFLVPLSTPPNTCNAIHQWHGQSYICALYSSRFHLRYHRKWHHGRMPCYALTDGVARHQHCTSF